MKILALELSTVKGSLAWSNDTTDQFLEWPNDRKSSGVFFESLKALTGESGTPEIIVVGLGPGSYAGTRIAISTAIGLQIASKARLLGYPSICALDCEETEYCVVGDARRQTFFFARIEAHELVEGPGLFSEAELRERIGAVNRDMPVFASEKLPQFERVQIRYPSARVLARLACDGKRSFVSPPLEPMYLREPHITVPKPIS